MFRHLLGIMVLQTSLTGGSARAESHPRLPVQTNQEAWNRLPEAPKVVQPLPVWARILAKPMPATTARMLELDAMHRTGDRLDARLRGLVRWAAADANQCEYSKSVAIADLKRAGFEEGIVEIAAKNPERLPKLDQVCVAFARKMMREAHAVTDAEFKQMLDVAGEERAVALVALLAHASFQDHLFLALNLPEEKSDAVPPITARFGRPKPAMDGSPPTTPEIALPKERPPAGAAWLRLQEGLDKQRARGGRIRVPLREELIQRLGGEKHPAAWQANILWSRVCYGYQPELTDAWFDVGGAFRNESDLERVFVNSIFWVVTDSLRCFY
jgi:alkylhydroperoxidase family enzyme